MSLPQPSFLNSSPSAPHPQDKPLFASPIARPRVAVLGMGYVGLPTGLALINSGHEVIGLDISSQRLEDIRSGRVDLLPKDHERLLQALARPDFTLTDQPRDLASADSVLVCVPTPVDGDLLPDLRALEGACRTVVDHARAGQLIVLTSTTYVGTTRKLVIEPLEAKGFTVGEDIFVAFAPERINPGDALNEQESVPRVYGAQTSACALRLEATLSQITPLLHRVSSPEAAEMTKLQENTFRAVNIALANEFAEACAHYDLNPIEVTQAAATKPYGYMAHYPGPGVGGHCIPCDPHYLLHPLRESGVESPLIAQAMRAIDERPDQVVDRVERLLEQNGKQIAGSRLLLVGVTYKAGVQDVRESPAVRILQEMESRGAVIAYHDPLVPQLRRRNDPALDSVVSPHGDDYDMTVLITLQPGADYAWLDSCPQVLDCTYRLRRAHSDQTLHLI